VDTMPPTRRRTLRNKRLSAAQLYPVLVPQGRAFFYPNHKYLHFMHFYFSCY
jgi:hypothetical protein